MCRAKDMTIAALIAAARVAWTDNNRSRCWYFAAEAAKRQGYSNVDDLKAIDAFDLLDMVIDIAGGP